MRSAGSGVNVTTVPPLHQDDQGDGLTFIILTQTLLPIHERREERRREERRRGGEERGEERRRRRERVERDPIRREERRRDKIILY